MRFSDRRKCDNKWPDIYIRSGSKPDRAFCTGEGNRLEKIPNVEILMFLFFVAGKANNPLRPGKRIPINNHVTFWIWRHWCVARAPADWKLFRSSSLAELSIIFPRYFDRSSIKLMSLEVSFDFSRFVAFSVIVLVWNFTKWMSTVLSLCLYDLPSHTFLYELL